MEGSARDRSREARQSGLEDLKEGLEVVGTLHELGWWLSHLVEELSDRPDGPLPPGNLWSRLGLNAVSPRALGRKKPRALTPILRGAVETLFRGSLSVSSWETLAEEIRCHELKRRDNLSPDAQAAVRDKVAGPMAWEAASLAGCNLLAGHADLLPEGKPTALQRHAVVHLRSLLERSSGLDDHVRWGEKECREELKKSHTSYTGEEVEVAMSLSVEQMAPALPPIGFGGSIDALPFLSPGTAEWLSNPRRLLKDPKEFVNHRFEAKIHVEKGQLVEVAKLLVERQVCVWVEESQVFRHKGRTLFNGLFGVQKGSLTPGGKPVLRTIMNLMPCNGLFLPLQYGHQGLVDIHCWGNIVVSGSDIVEISQSDMTSAFYLFRIPPDWWPYLSFKVDSKKIVSSATRRAGTISPVRCSPWGGIARCRSCRRLVLTS